ncbi:MAG: lytic transglycosylase domain-containing protein [Campylobacterota bacterium]|nr:lytic transglycosylase domain-containing protein [Campylobacterota bacterium]
MKKLLLLTLLTASLFSSDDKITLSWLEKQPKSYAKDFYIWRYLDKDITKEQSCKVLEQVKYMNNKIFYRYIDRSKDKNLLDLKACMKAKTKDLVHKEAYCIEAGLSIYDATKLSKKELSKVIKKTKVEYKEFTQKLDIINSPLPFKTLEQSVPKVFFDTFNMTGSFYRNKYFNHYFSHKLIRKLKNEKYKKEFTQTIKLIVTNLNMKKAQTSLLKLSSEDLSFKAVFHLAINAIRHNKEDLAMVYLEDALEKAYYKMEKDNITFWQYLITKDKKYLEKVASSWDVNIYTLYANEMLKKEQENIIYKIEQHNKSSNYNLKDPFSWLKVLKESKKMDNNKLTKYETIFTDNETLGHLAFVKERYDRYKKSYFVMPYEKYIGDLEKNRQSLIYAIGRQESRFIPTSISSAYAMGTMQIMPFLSKALAKQLKVPYDIDKQLEAKTNLKFANHHLNYLERKLKHPLLISYAYNGGIGFTSRLLKTGLFKKNSSLEKYEPFLSMELLPYDETKKYGKKVLANYYIYQNHINKQNQVKLEKLIKSVLN